MHTIQDSTWRTVSWWSIRDGEGHSQETMPPNWLARVVVLSSLTACGLDLGGEEFTVAEDPSAADASASNDPAVDAAPGPNSTTEGGPDAAAVAPSAESGLPEDAGAMKTQAPPEVEASAVDAPPAEARPPDASDEPRTPCERLAKCCAGQVTLLPGVAFGCMLGAAEADGGDAGACASILEGLTGAGLCSLGSSDASLEE
jgi:hypothetical protein